LLLLDLLELSQDGLRIHGGSVLLGVGEGEGDSENGSREKPTKHGPHDEAFSAGRQSAARRKMCRVISAGQKSRAGTPQAPVPRDV